MEKGPSEYAEFWTSEFNEVSHIKRHSKHMKFKNPYDYSKAAKEFALNQDPNILSFKSMQGATYKYNPDTNEFIIISRYGKIVTYFPPDRGID